MDQCHPVAVPSAEPGSPWIGSSSKLESPPRASSLPGNRNVAELVTCNQPTWKEYLSRYSSFSGNNVMTPRLSAEHLLLISSPKTWEPVEIWMLSCCKNLLLRPSGKLVVKHTSKPASWKNDVCTIFENSINSVALGSTFSWNNSKRFRLEWHRLRAELELNAGDAVVDLLLGIVANGLPGAQWTDWNAHGKACVKLPSKFIFQLEYMNLSYWI